MTLQQRVELFRQDHEAETTAQRFGADQAILVELIKVLTPFPGGLRRWSVMRALRNARAFSTREIPQKFENDVERVFRRFCADADDGKTKSCAAKDALFYRPKEKAGEVWCVYSDRAEVRRIGGAPAAN